MAPSGNVCVSLPEQLSPQPVRKGSRLEGLSFRLFLRPPGCDFISLLFLKTAARDCFQSLHPKRFTKKDVVLSHLSPSLRTGLQDTLPEDGMFVWELGHSLPLPDGVSAVHHLFSSLPMADWKAYSLKSRQLISLFWCHQLCPLL